MITLTDIDGSPIAINPLAIAFVKPDEKGAQIAMTSGGLIQVKESFEEVNRRLKAWTKS